MDGQDEDTWMNRECRWWEGDFTRAEEVAKLDYSWLARVT